MARRHLEGLAVAHHHLAGDRVRRAGEPLRPCLDPAQYRHRQAVAQERRVDVVVDRAGEAGGIGFRRVGRVAFLPEELARAKETRGRSSQRTTLAHWLSSSGRSR
jgi:hypothetical protein